MTTPHSNPDELIDLLLAGDTPDARAELDRRVAADPAAVPLVEGLRTMLDSLHAMKSELAVFQLTDEQRTKLVKLFTPARPSLARRLTDGVRELVAGITFDSLRQPALVGVRGSGSARVIRLECDEATIDLRISSGSTGQSVQVSGQIESSTRFSTIVGVPHSGAGELSAAVDHEGFFDLQFERGTYDLHFESVESMVVIDSIEIDTAMAP